jgi:hypothetical protein
MGPPDVEALLAGLAAAVPEELDRDGCSGRLRDLSRLWSWLGADELRTTRQLKALAAQGARGAGRVGVVEQWRPFGVRGS